MERDQLWAFEDNADDGEDMGICHCESWRGSVGFVAIGSGAVKIEGFQLFMVERVALPPDSLCAIFRFPEA